MFLGIDLGTSSVRAAVVDESGNIVGIGQKEYAIISPHPGWAEQEPEVWWRSTCEATQSALAAVSVNPSDISAVGLSGQMHGTILLGKGDVPVCPAIIWADSRSDQEAELLNMNLGQDRLARIAGNKVSPGFQAATLAWLRANRPDLLERTIRVLLPKDYLRLRLTGVTASEPSDASATLLFDVGQWCWSQDLVEAAGIERSMLPEVLPSVAEAGKLTKEAAKDLGLAAGIPVVAGAGDQAAQAVGNGVIHADCASSTIGTGGQLFQPSSSASYDQELRVHLFCHAVPDTWFVMAATLSAGLSLRWLRDLLNLSGAEAYESLSAEAEAAGVGAQGLLFLPYLLGERTPYMDAQARGGFLGLTLRHSRGHLARAIMEGVTFSLRDGMRIMAGLVNPPERLIASGGGARSGLWVQIQADVLGVPITRVKGEERAVVGAAMLAGIGTGAYAGFTEAVEACVRYDEIVEPQEEASKLYGQLYGRYCKLYKLLKEDMHFLSEFEHSLGMTEV